MGNYEVLERIEIKKDTHFRAQYEERWVEKIDSQDRLKKKGIKKNKT